MKVHFSQLVVTSAVAMTLGLVGWVSQPAFAQSDSESGQTLSTESHNNCGSHGTEGHDQHQHPRRNRKK